MCIYYSASFDSIILTPYQREKATIFSVSGGFSFLSNSTQILVQLRNYWCLHDLCQLCFILQSTVFYFADESKSHFISFFPLLITNPSQPIVIYSIQTVLGSWCHLVAENFLNQPYSSKVSSFLEKFCITQCHCFPLFFFLYLTCTINNFSYTSFWTLFVFPSPFPHFLTVSVCFLLPSVAVELFKQNPSGQWLISISRVGGINVSKKMENTRSNYVLMNSFW